MPAYFPGAACAPCDAPDAGLRDTPGLPENWPLRRRVGRSCCPSQPCRCRRQVSRAGAGLQLGTPGKLKNWKPDMVHGFAARQNPRIPDFQVSRFSLTPPEPVRHSGRFLHGLIDQIRRTGRRLLQSGRGQMRVAHGHLGIRVSHPSLTVARTFSRVLENGSKHKQ